MSKVKNSCIDKCTRFKEQADYLSRIAKQLASLGEKMDKKADDMTSYLLGHFYFKSGHYSEWYFNQAASLYSLSKKFSDDATSFYNRATKCYNDKAIDVLKNLQRDARAADGHDNFPDYRSSDVNFRCVWPPDYKK